MKLRYNLINLKYIGEGSNTTIDTTTPEGMKQLAMLIHILLKSHFQHSVLKMKRIHLSQHQLHIHRILIGNNLKYYEKINI